MANYFIDLGGGGGGSTSLSIGTFDGQAGVADGLFFTSNVLYAQSATASVPGMVNTTTQTMAGAKTFSTSVLSPIFSTNASNPASAGVIRLANLEFIKWRNAGFSADLGIQLDASNILQLGTATTVTGTLSTSTILLTGDGAVGAPAHSFTSDTDCGTYRIGANNLGVAVNGAKVLDIGTAGLGVTGTLTSAVHTITGVSDASQLVVKANATQTTALVDWQNSSSTTLTKMTGLGDFYFNHNGNATTPNIQWTADSGLKGFYAPSGDRSISYGVNGTEYWHISASEVRDFVNYNANPGSVSAPGIFFNGSSATGLYRIGADNIGVTINGTKLLDMAATALGISGVTTIGTPSQTSQQHVINGTVKTNGAQVGTLSNAPTAGNPTGYLQVTINGTTSYLPYWQ